MDIGAHTVPKTRTNTLHIRQRNRGARSVVALGKVRILTIFQTLQPSVGFLASQVFSIGLKRIPDT